MERANSLWRSLDLLDTGVLALALVENVVRDDEALDVPKADRAGRIVAVLFHVPAEPQSHGHPILNAADVDVCVPIDVDAPAPDRIYVIVVDLRAV